MANQHCPACGHPVTDCRCRVIKEMQLEEERKPSESGYFEKVRKEKEQRKR